MKSEAMDDTLTINPKHTDVSATIRKTFPVTGMSCASCASSAQSILETVIGVKSVSVNYANEQAQVVFDPQKASSETLQEALRSVGYDLLIQEDNAKQEQADLKADYYQRLKTRVIWEVALSLPIVAIGMSSMEMPHANWIMMALAFPVVFIFGGSYFKGAWSQLWHGKANMDTLVALSTGIAFTYSAFTTLFPSFWRRLGLSADVYFEASAVIIAFITIGKFLEEGAKQNTSSALKKLIGLQPKTVLLLDGGQVREVPIASLRSGNVLRVRAGERVAVDGRLISGESFVNESMISGEPIAVLKLPGDSVFAGTINQKGSFEFSAEKVGSGTVLAEIIKAVENAQGSRAPIQKLADKIASIFVPVVLGIAALTFLLWILLDPVGGPSHGLLAAISVLVIACPCALGLATPTAIMVGMGKGAEDNILIKDAESLERARSVTAVVLDKTGTLTVGKPVVKGVFFDAPVEEREELNSVLLALESRSEHPLAGAIIKELASQHVVPSLEVEKVESITGGGIIGSARDTQYMAGNEKLLLQRNITISDSLKQTAVSWEAGASTVIYFAEGGQAKLAIALSDVIKESSKAAVAKLKSLGIEVHMLTGDNEATAAAISLEAGIDHYKAGVLPSDKGKYIHALQDRGKIVAMVGDGINDAEALAVANVSIAMGKGSDIAIDVAQMTLLSSDLAIIPKALELSRKTVETIRQNLFWAFIYNLVGIPVAAGLLYPFNGFLLNPMIAGAAMALSSVSVVTNSLRLKSLKL